MKVDTIEADLSDQVAYTKTLEKMLTRAAHEVETLQHAIPELQACAWAYCKVLCMPFAIGFWRAPTCRPL